MPDRKSETPEEQGSSCGVGEWIKSVLGVSVSWSPTLREIPAVAVQPGKRM